ncbi:MAG: hypothetical protein Q8P65_00580 [bacterium]|nr:hypothetical protein [bacterium]
MKEWSYMGLSEAPYSIAISGGLTGLKWLERTAFALSISTSFNEGLIQPLSYTLGFIGLSVLALRGNIRISTAKDFDEGLRRLQNGDFN